jgi:ABC-type Fe3+/spermidine/putrescine transport system ATPase subunit
MSDRIAVMNQGRFEQIGLPSDLYERPRSKFVADFIGETNFIEAVVLGERGERLELVTPKGIKILASMRYSLSKKEVSVAIRPERISFVKSLQDRLNTYKGIVEEAIYLGDTLKYKISVEGKESIIVTQKNDLVSDRYEIGDQILIGWQDEDMNLV